MNWRRLLHTSAMQIALRYAGLYALLIVVGLGFLYWASSGYVDEQIETGLTQRMAELLQIEQKQGRASLIAALNAQQTISNGQQFLLLAPNGQQLAGNLNGWPVYLKTYGRVANVWIAGKLISSQSEDGYYPMIAEKLSDGSRLLLAQSLQQAEELMETILYTILLILLISVLLAITMGWFMGRALVVRIDLINRTAQAITKGDFTQRVPVTARNDEFDQLANHLNTMLQRVEQLLTGLRQVTDNVAHDLRQPLSRLRNRLEITLLEARDTSEYQQVLMQTIEDADNLIRTFNALLEIAQTEAGSFRGEWTTVELSGLLEGLGGLYKELAHSQGKQLKIKVQKSLCVIGNRHLLAQAISNLLDNAIKYTDTNGRILLEAKQQNEGVVVIISDNGPGIPAEKYAIVLERFTRLDTARSSSGSGLGLSLVKAVMDLHKASLSLADNKTGLRVSLHFTSATPQLK
ncbi:MAG: ATP-binding protein [Methylococcaceae bacterium]